MKRLRSRVQSSRRDSAHFRGYTLIEMLIAVSLVVVLLTAVWGLLSMYSTLQTVGAETTAEQQLVRSVMQLMRNDLSKVPLPTADTTATLNDRFAAFDRAEGHQGSGSDHFVEDSFSVVVDINNLWRNENGGPANISIHGTADVIKLTVPALTGGFEPVDDLNASDQPGGSSARVTQSLPDGVMPPVDEFQTIVYQFQRFGSTEDGGLPFGLYRVQADAGRLQTMLARPSRSEFEPAQEVIRLDRGLIEELLFPSGDERQQQFDSMPREPTCDLIPDVVGCRFQYHSGDRWQPNWKSEHANRLPVAIRVTLEIVSTRELDELRALFVPEGPPGRLEQRLNRTFARPEDHTGRSRGHTDVQEVQITPRSYSSLILLDSTAEAGAHSSIDGSLAGGPGQ